MQLVRFITLYFLCRELPGPNEPADGSWSDGKSDAWRSWADGWRTHEPDGWQPDVREHGRPDESDEQPDGRSSHGRATDDGRRGHGPADGFWSDGEPNDGFFWANERRPDDGKQAGVLVNGNVHLLQLGEFFHCTCGDLPRVFHS